MTHIITATIIIVLWGFVASHEDKKHKAEIRLLNDRIDGHVDRELDLAKKLSHRDNDVDTSIKRASVAWKKNEQLESKLSKIKAALVNGELSEQETLLKIEETINA